MLGPMRHLRLVGGTGTEQDVRPVAGSLDRPMVSLRLLMAASGRCSCDDCLLAYRAGDKHAGVVRVGRARDTGLSAVR